MVNGSRWFLGGALAGISGLFWFRQQVGDPADCFVNPYCKKCGQNSSCSLLASAKSVKDEKQRRK